MRNQADIWGSVFLIFLGIAVTIGALGLGLGNVEQLRPGFLPFLSGIALSTLSLFLLIRTWQGQTGPRERFQQWRRPVAVLAGLVFYVIIFNYLGYLISTAILSGIILRVFDMKSKWVLITVSIGIAVGTYLLFDGLLAVHLPAGRVLSALSR